MFYRIVFPVIFLAVIIKVISAGDDSVVLPEFNYRILNWCVVGQGEHPLYQWPINQLKPYLLHADRLRKFSDNTHDKAKIKVEEPKSLTLQFKKIGCDDSLIKDKNIVKQIGDGSGVFLQRTHVVFKSDVPFQGLLIQGAHAPFGLGFPFGQFDQDNEFTCNDCEHKFSRIIGCISRPDVELIHPTTAAFHFKTTKWNEDSKKMEELGPRQELHWNFKWADNDCSSARIVEFWVLIVFDFDFRVWMVKKFGPYDFSSKDNVILPSPSEPFKDKIRQPRLPSPIFPECNPLPPTMDVIAKTIGTPPEYPDACFREYGLGYNATKCWFWKERLTQKFLADKANEKKYGSRIKCEGGDYDFKPIGDWDGTTKWSPIRFVGDFDTDCIQYYNRDRKGGKKVFRHPYQICSTWQGKFFCTAKDDEKKLNEPFPIGNPGPGRRFPSSACDPCPTEKVTDSPPDDGDGNGFIKRGVHGSMMSFAFFFFLPVSITICRFYKETLHDREFKGWRLWLVIHVGLAGLVVLISYISYTLPSFHDLDAHIIFGYAALFCCAGGLCSGWFRNKNDTILTASFYIHALSGYAGWGLAIACMVLAPGIGYHARMLCYFASGFSLAAMAVLTCHICTVDHKMGMHPRRSHIPIVEIRFDDLFPPGHKFRKIFLYIYISVQFLVCCGMLTL